MSSKKTKSKKVFKVVKKSVMKKSVAEKHYEKLKEYDEVSKEERSKKSPEKVVEQIDHTEKAQIVRLSPSGKYRSLRHLMDDYFAKTKNLSFDKVADLVAKEYPGRKFTRRDFSWYKTMTKRVKEGDAV